MTDRDATEKVEIDWLRAVAGALAAVASAVLLSTLGAAGTVIGAAIGSFVVTVGSALLAQGLSSGKRTLSKKQKGAAENVGIAQAEVLRAAGADDIAARESHLDQAEVLRAAGADDIAARESHLDQAEERLADANAELDEAVDSGSPVNWRERLSRLQWKRIGLVTLGLFVVAIGVITAFELVAGRSVSSITGGSDSGDTTMGQVTGLESGGENQQEPDDVPTGSISPNDTATPSAEPSESASPSQSQEPTSAESTAPTPGATVPTPAATAATPVATPAATTTP